MTDLRVALVTCAELPTADADTQLLIAPLAANGVWARPVVWDDPRVDWESFDLAIVRSCWDYTIRRDDFLAWAARVPRLENRRAVLAWNTDKSYLTTLDDLGVAIVPTIWVRPNEDWRVGTRGGDAELRVIKPAVSLCALDTGRYDLNDATERALAEDHVRRLLAAGRTVMVQPYMWRIDVGGETSLVFLGGEYSHAVRKEAVLRGPDRGEDNRFVPQGSRIINRWEPTHVQLQLATKALEAVPGGRARLLYARVDLVPGSDGEPVVMEIELTEPNLFFSAAPNGLARFATEIARRAARNSTEAPS